MSILEDIEKEDWRKAKGIIASSTETNSGLATRDYSVKCGIPHLIIQIKGYHLWWCSTHHQPLPWCEKAKLKEESEKKTVVLNKIKEAIKGVKI